MSNIQDKTPPVTNVDTKIDSKGAQETTQFGVKVDSRDSLTAGERGALLMEDFVYREKMTHFGT
jgi:catalase